MYCKAKQFVTKSLPIVVKSGKTNLIIRLLQQNEIVLVEKRRLHEIRRAVRYAISHVISRPCGTFREGVVAFFYQPCVPNGTSDRFVPFIFYQHPVPNGTLLQKKSTLDSHNSVIQKFKS